MGIELGVNFGNKRKFNEVELGINIWGMRGKTTRVELWVHENEDRYIYLEITKNCKLCLKPKNPRYSVC